MCAGAWAPRAPLRAPSEALRGVLSHSEGLRASLWALGAPDALRPSEWLRTPLRLPEPPPAPSGPAAGAAPLLP
nr:MAG TPA: hypothetical protein [Caudoviricetes sp.]